MSRMLVLLVAAALVAGCQAKPRATAAVANSPQTIDELTNQTVVYECPQCGMDYDGPGQCSMDHVDLVKTRIDYICPADNQPVDRAGKCPRCAANVTVKRTALAPAVPKALSGN